MAYIRKLPSGKWQAQIERHGRKWSKTFPAKREAQAWATAEEAKAPDSGFTFVEAVQKYRTEVTPRKPSRVWEDRRFKFYLAHFGEDTPLTAIDAPQIAAWRDTMLQTVTGSTVNRDSNLLRNIFSVARDEWRWIEHNPFRGVKMPPENYARSAIWPWRLIKRVLRAPRTGKTAEMQAAFHIALRTGMRLSEVLQAPPRFDKNRRVVLLPRTKTEANAVVPVGRIAARLLDRPPFTVNANEGSVLFSRLTRELLIDGLTFHDARGTALTHLARKVDVLTLAKISRHRDLSLLMRVYYRPTPESIAARI